MTHARRRTWAALAAMLAVTGVVQEIAIAQDDQPGREIDDGGGRREPEPAMRTWTDRTGKYTTRAEMVGVENDTVRLRKDDGKMVSVPLARLSRADQEYVRAMVEHGRGKPRQPQVRITVEYTPAPNDAERKIYAALNQPVSLKFESLGLAEFVTTLQREFEIPIEVHLDAAFDQSQVSLTADGQEMPLDLALTRVFEGTDLGHMVINGALVILPSSEAEHRQIERTYAVEDVTKDARDLQDLIAAVATTCRPADWSYVGGMGEIAPLESPRRLHVKQAFGGHQEIVRFLRACKVMQASAALDDVIGELVESLESPDKAIRAAAFYMLARLGPEAKPAVPVLIRALAIQFDRRTLFDDLAAHTLLRIGDAALPELTRAASSDDEILARQAQRVIDRITNRPGGLGSGAGGGFF